VSTALKSDFPDLQPEEQFLLRCLKCAFSGEGGHYLADMDTPSLNWGTIFQTALNWNVAPMLYPMVKNRSNLPTLLRVPDDIFRAIQAAYIKTCMINQTCFSELAKIVTAFAAEDIDVLLLKGGHLAPFIYGDIGVRWMSDIDILIKRENFNKAHNQLSEMGYQYPDMVLAVWDDFGRRTELGDKEAVIKWYKTDHMHLNYFSPDGIQNLELHWGIARIASPFAIDVQGLWDRASRRDLNGTSVWVLSPEDLILHLCLHDAYYHHLKLFGLRPCCDIAAVVHRFSEGIDWHQVQERAKAWGVEKYLYLMLCLSRQLLQTEMPPGLLRTMSDKWANRRIKRQSLRRILGKIPPRPPSCKGIKYPGDIQTFSPDEGLLEELRFFLKRVPISREELASRYSVPVSSNRLVFYRFRRLVGLVLSYAQLYGAYSWYRFIHRQATQTDYTLDLWLKTP
jgi:hypothetical protein